MIMDSFGRYAVETIHDHELERPHGPVRDGHAWPGLTLMVLSYSRHAPVPTDTPARSGPPAPIHPGLSMIVNSFGHMAPLCSGDCRNA